MTYRQAHKFEIPFLILKNQSIRPIKVILLFRQIKDSFKGLFKVLNVYQKKF